MDRARKAFETGRSKPLEYRIEQLKNLQRLFAERQREIADAIKKDLNKVKWPLLSVHPESRKLENCLSKNGDSDSLSHSCRMQTHPAIEVLRSGGMLRCCVLHPQSEVGAQLYETLGLEGEISLAIRKLKEWAAPRPVEKNLLTISDTVYIRPEPLGVVLIIGAWNYPWAVTIQPLVGAIAAGTMTGPL